MGFINQQTSLGGTILNHKNCTRRHSLISFVLAAKPLGPPQLAGEKNCAAQRASVESAQRKPKKSSVSDLQ